jgi:hypothetical protein
MQVTLHSKVRKLSMLIDSSSAHFSMKPDNILMISIGYFTIHQRNMTATIRDKDDDDDDD